MFEGTINLRNLLLGRDLLFTWYAFEIWGQRAHLDPLSYFFKDIFNNADLVDMEPFP